MTDSRYPTTRVGDPDETARIPREALDELRDADARDARDAARDAARDGTRPARPEAPSTGPSESGPSGPAAGSGVGSGATAVTGRNGAPASSGATGATVAGPPPLGAPGMNGSGYPSDGTPAVPGGSAGSVSGRPAVFGSGSSGSVVGGATVPGAPTGAAAGAGAARASRSGRSETGYSPSAYPNPYSQAYPSLGEPPTAVTGGPASTAAARSSLAASAGAAGRPAGRTAPGPRPARRARLLVRHIDPWSTLKFSFVLAIAMFFVWLVAVGVLYLVLDGMGVFEQINGLYSEVSGNSSDRLFSPGLVLGTAMLVGAVNIVLFTALATIGAFVYNICSDLVGGIEVTLAERE